MAFTNTVSISIGAGSHSPAKRFTGIPWFPGITVLHAMIIGQAMNPPAPTDPQKGFSFRAVYHSFYGAFIDEIDDVADRGANYWLFSVNNAKSVTGASEAIILEDQSGVNVEIEWVYGVPMKTASHRQQLKRKQQLTKTKAK